MASQTVWFKEPLRCCLALLHTQNNKWVSQGDTQAVHAHTVLRGCLITQNNEEHLCGWTCGVGYFQNEDKTVVKHEFKYLGPFFKDALN